MCKYSKCTTHVTVHFHKYVLTNTNKFIDKKKSHKFSIKLKEFWLADLKLVSILTLCNVWEFYRFRKR